ncbi:ABC transporter ATP-binding protein [Enterococcus sp.]|uniref:ABC transporter ATP-binding protein n=1 Tax=Enterococcus sp. TaxID=35783 RepID=UPI002897E629|nr:ABC transporter ATP-binding protein [Enterococcus sp.]
MALLELKNIHKTYTGEVSVDVLQHIDLKVPEGEFISIMGPSGSGKTTMLNLVATLDQPTSGTVIIKGEQPLTLSKEKLARFRRQQLGFVFQNYNLLAPLTVAENVMLPLTLDRVPVGEMQQRCAALLDELGIAEKAEKRIYQLSGGEQQRVAIARALIHQPELLLADEPTGNLDSKAARDVMEILSRMNQQRKVTTMMVTHDPYSASFSDRIVFIKDGKLYNELYRGSDQQQFYQKILDVLAHLGGRRHEFQTVDHS